MIISSLSITLPAGTPSNPSVAVAPLPQGTPYKLTYRGSLRWGPPGGTGFQCDPTIATVTGIGVPPVGNSLPGGFIGDGQTAYVFAKNTGPQLSGAVDVTDLAT